jgi:hypothetical protein
VERRHNGGDERWWLELNVRVKEGARELEREGKRGGEGQGCSSPFYRARREAEVAGIGGVAAVNGVLNGAITGVKEGGECGRVKAGNDGLDRSGPLHGPGGGRRGDLGTVACEEEVALGQCR